MSQNPFVYLLFPKQLSFVHSRKNGISTSPGIIYPFTKLKYFIRLFWAYQSRKQPRYIFKMFHFIFFRLPILKLLSGMT